MTDCLPEYWEGSPTFKELPVQLSVNAMTQVLKIQMNKMLSEERRKLQRSLMLRKKKIKFRRVCVYIKYMFIDIYEYLLEIRWKSLEENLQRGKEF